MAPSNAINYSAVELPLQDWSLNKNILLAGSIPFVVLSIWYLTRRIKRLIPSQKYPRPGHVAGVKSVRGSGQRPVR